MLSPRYYSTVSTSWQLTSSLPFKNKKHSVPDRQVCTVWKLLIPSWKPQKITLMKHFLCHSNTRRKSKRSGVAQLTGHRVEFQMTWVQPLAVLWTCILWPWVKVLVSLPALVFVSHCYLWKLWKVVGLRVKPPIKLGAIGEEKEGWKWLHFLQLCCSPSRYSVLLQVGDGYIWLGIGWAGSIDPWWPWL